MVVGMLTVLRNNYFVSFFMLTAIFLGFLGKTQSSRAEPVYNTQLKQEQGECFSDPEFTDVASEGSYLHNYFHQRLLNVRSDLSSRSTILCIPIPANGTIPKMLNHVFNIDAVNQMLGKALGTGERPPPDVDVPIDDDHAFFEAEYLDEDEIGEDNRQEIRATGVLKFFDLIPDWLANQLDASIVPFEDRWLATLDINLKSTGHIMVSPLPIGMQLGDKTNRRIIVTSFVRGTVNTNENVPYPMDFEFDYDPMLGFLDDDIDIPGSGRKNILAINEIYDSGNSTDEQLKALQEAQKDQNVLFDNIAAEVIPDEDRYQFETVEDDELLEVELTLTGHRLDEIELELEQQVVVYVHPRHLGYAQAQFADNKIFLSAEVSISLGLYNPGAPPEGQVNHESNDFLQFYLNIREANGKSLEQSIKLHGGPLLALAKLKLPGHLPRNKPLH